MTQTGWIAGAARGCALLAAMLLWACTPRGTAEMAEGPGIENFPSAAARQFVEAVASGRVDRALALVQGVPDGVNTKGGNGETAILIATMRGDSAMVRALLTAGADPNGGPNKTPLHPAVRQTNGEMLAMLLAAKADPNRTYNNETPLFEAALIGAIPAAARLLDAGAQPDLGRVTSNDSPLLVASATKKWAMANFLIERGASPWHVNEAGATVASNAYHSNSNSPDRDAIIARFQAYGYPWPPPKPPVVRQMMAEGRWPPKLNPPR